MVKKNPAEHRVSYVKFYLIHRSLLLVFSFDPKVESGTNQCHTFITVLLLRLFGAISATK